jgi:hypothetical protein
MRRRPRKFLPVVLAALAIQIAAQAGAGWAAALAVSDPLASFPICHSSADATPAGSHQGNDTGQDDSCAACCLLTANVSIDTPLVTTLVMPLHREVVAVLRGYKRRSLPAARIGSNSLARGPPQTI